MCILFNKNYIWNIIFFITNKSRRNSPVLYKNLLDSDIYIRFDKYNHYFFYIYLSR